MSLAVELAHLQNEVFSIYENLKALSELGLPYEWEMGRWMQLAERLIENISIGIRERDLEGNLDQVDKFYAQSVKSKNYLGNWEKSVVDCLKKVGYGFVYSKSGKDLEKILGLRNPLIGDCLIERAKLRIYSKNLKKINPLLKKAFPTKSKERKNLEKRIKDIGHIDELMREGINFFLSVEEFGEIPKMDFFFSEQEDINEENKIMEKRHKKILESLGYELVYDHYYSIKKIIKKSKS